MKNITLVFISSLLLFWSCKTLFAKKNIIIEGNITVSKENIPINSKLEFYYENELISFLDSTLHGKYRLDINKKWFNKKCYFVISESKGIVEKTDWLPSGLLDCSMRKDTILIYLDSFIKNKNINIGECDFEVEDYSPHK